MENDRAAIDIMSVENLEGHLDGTVSRCVDTTLPDAILGDMASPCEAKLALEGNDNNGWEQSWEIDNGLDIRMGIIESGTNAGSPKTLMDIDSDQPEGDEIVKRTTIERIG